jgi:hypothetical protein
MVETGIMKNNFKQISFASIAMTVVLSLFGLSFHDLAHNHLEDSVHQEENTNLPSEPVDIDDCIYCTLSTEAAALFSESHFSVHIEESSYLRLFSSEVNNDSYTHFFLRAPPCS